MRLFSEKDGKSKLMFLEEAGVGSSKSGRRRERERERRRKALGGESMECEQEDGAEISKIRKGIEKSFLSRIHGRNELGILGNFKKGEKRG